MRFSKTIVCNDVKMEITADTCTMIEKKGENLSFKERIASQKEIFDVYEFLATYGNNPDVAKMARLINTTITEIPFQVDFWREFCSILVKSASAGFWGVEHSECLPTIYEEYILIYSFHSIMQTIKPDGTAKISSERRIIWEN